MIKAKEANLNTKTTIEKFAKEFIWNECGSKIQSAIDGGWFHTNVSLNKVPNAQYVGSVVVELLNKEYGYEAEFIYEDTYRQESSYICIDWSKE